MLEPVMTVLSEKEVAAMTEPAAPAARLWRARLLDYLDAHAADMVADLAGLVRVPSISGTAEENTIQDVLSARLAGDGLDVDAWPIPMAETLAAGDFPGVEVELLSPGGSVAVRSRASGARSRSWHCPSPPCSSSVRAPRRRASLSRRRCCRRSSRVSSSACGSTAFRGGRS